MCVLCTCTVYCILFPPPPLLLKFVPGMAGNYCQQLRTVKSGAYDLVWQTVCCFIASQQGGGREGELGKILFISLHYLAQGERQGGGQRLAFPPLVFILDHKLVRLKASRTTDYCLHEKFSKSFFQFSQRGLKPKRPMIVFFLGPTKPLPSYDYAKPHRRYSVS